MFDSLMGLWKDESGGAAMEYGLVAALVSITVIGALTAIGPSLSTIFGAATTALDSTVAVP